MFTGLKSLFSSNKLMDNVASGVDKVILTKEEKLDNFNTMLGLYAPFKIAQRLLALVFCIPYAIAFLIAFICSFWLDVSKQFEMLQGDISTIVGVVMVFYFGGGAVEGIIGVRKSKK